MRLLREQEATAEKASLVEEPAAVPGSVSAPPAWIVIRIGLIRPQWFFFCPSLPVFSSPSLFSHYSCSVRSLLNGAVSRLGTDPLLEFYPGCPGSQVV